MPVPAEINSNRSLSARRAWIEIKSGLQPLIASLSLSARRAWIEIVEFHLFASSGVVALRKESVDRNTDTSALMKCQVKSLSARRAWIEMLADTSEVEAATGRSPQGERG